MEAGSLLLITVTPSLAPEVFRAHRLRLPVKYDHSHFHRHGAGLLVPRGRGLRLGGGGVRDL